MSVVLAPTRTSEQQHLFEAAWLAFNAWRKQRLEDASPKFAQLGINNVLEEGTSRLHKQALRELDAYVASFGRFHRPEAGRQFEDEWAKAEAEARDDVSPLPLPPRQMPRKADGSLYNRRDGIDWAERHQTLIHMREGLTRSELDAAFIAALAAHGVRCSKRTALRTRQVQTEAEWWEERSAIDGRVKRLYRTKRGSKLLSVSIGAFAKICREELPRVDR